MTVYPYTLYSIYTFIPVFIPKSSSRKDLELRPFFDISDTNLLPLDFVVNETDVIKDITECMIENIDEKMQALWRK